MRYFTNHSWCSESCWDNKCFNSEVIVSIKEFIDTDRISCYKNKLQNPDWNNLIEIKKDCFDEKAYNNHLNFVETYKKNYKDEEITFSLTKSDFIKENRYLKQEVIDWLNENIKNKLGSNKNTPLEDKKGWAIGNDAYRLTDHSQLNIFFDRQIDALKFIRKFSIFKEPTNYFDYFEDTCADMEPEKILSIINKETNQNLTLNDIVLENKQISKNIKIIEMDYNNFNIKVWNRDGECKDLKGEKLKEAIAEILSVDEEENLNNDFSM